MRRRNNKELLSVNYKIFERIKKSKSDLKKEIFLSDTERIRKLYNSVKERKNFKKTHGKQRQTSKYQTILKRNFPNIHHLRSSTLKIKPLKIRRGSFATIRLSTEELCDGIPKEGNRHLLHALTTRNHTKSSKLIDY